MKPQEYRHIMTLREPLKTLALGCTSGSLDGITALSDYLSQNFQTFEPRESARIIPAVLKGLFAAGDVPPALDFETFRQVKSAFLHLSTFFYLSVLSREEDAAARRFVKHEATIFPWLTFLQRHLFGCPEPNLLFAIPDARPDFLMIVKHVIQIIIEYIQRPDPEIDFTRCEYLTDTIFEFWILLQRTSFDGCNAEMMMVATYTNGVVAALIEASTKTNNFQFVDKIGGVSVVVPLFLSCIDYYWNEARSQFKREIPVAAFCPLEQALYDMVPFAASSVYNDHIDIPAVFRYSGTVIHWVLSNRPRIIEDLPDGFHNGHTTPIAYLQNYIGFVANTLSHKRYYSLWHDLDLELLKLIRSGLPPEFGEASFAMEEFEYLLEFISFYAQWFPVVLRKALKLLHLPTLPAYQAIWDSFDDDVEPQGRGLESSLRFAVRHGLCQRCGKLPRSRKLRVCSGCHVVRYCSTRCQSDAWKSEHRVVCKLLRFSGGTHPMICTNDTIGVTYVANFELLSRKMCHFPMRVQEALSRPPRIPIPPDELPVISLSIPKYSSDFKVTRKRFSDFPSIFGGDEWPTLIMPLFKRVIEKGKMPGYLVVLSLTMFDDDRLHLLSPYDTVTGAGLLPKVDFDRLLNI